MPLLFRVLPEICPSILRFLAALTLAVVLCSTERASAEIIRAQDMVRGIVTTYAQCAATPNTVWVTVYERDFCVRYYISTVGGSGNRPVVFLQGDRLGPRDKATGQWKDPSNFTDIDTADLQKMADAFSTKTLTTAIYLGRIGVEGTSGNHADRHTLLELELVNAALDSIKQRHVFDGFHLAGQSGGSLVIGGLIGLRDDIACAVAGSGPLGSQSKFRPQDPARSFISPIDAIPAAVKNRSLRFYLVTDPLDRKVPADNQISFAQAMRRAGRPINEFFVEATDPDHHGATSFTRIVVAGCVLGKSDLEIAAAVDDLSRRNVALNSQNMASTRIGPSGGTGSGETADKKARGQPDERGVLRRHRVIEKFDRHEAILNHGVAALLAKLRNI
jgi:hypothetical protein